MSSPMAASVLKINRAKKHLEELEQIVRRYIESDPIKYETSVGEPQQVGTMPDGKKHMTALITYNFKQEAMPEETSAVLGDIIHNLRAALDLMATELCRAEDDPDDQTHFPFARKEEDFEKRLIDTGFARAGHEALKLIREIKPYPGGNDLLRAIHDLDIRDKHKRLIVNAMSFGAPIIDLGPPEKTASCAKNCRRSYKA